MTDSAGIWRFGRREFDLSLRPCIMGILNVTPDSFSDGSLYTSVDAAVEAGHQMIAAGADIIDIGGESTRPGASAVAAEEELERVMPVIERLAGAVNVPLSIDTWKASVAEAALQAGAEIINDISALTFDRRMAEVAAAGGAGLVLMHTSGPPDKMQQETRYTDIVDEIKLFLLGAVNRAEAAGCVREQLVVDPGIGFGKSVAGNLEIIRRLREFESLQRPLLIGTSRKSFIGAVLGRQVTDRLYGSLASIAVAMMNGAGIFRVHDVKAARDAVDMVKAIGCSI